MMLYLSDLCQSGIRKQGSRIHAVGLRQAGRQRVALPECKIRNVIGKNMQSAVHLFLLQIIDSYEAWTKAIPDVLRYETRCGLRLTNAERSFVLVFF